MFLQFGHQIVGGLELKLVDFRFFYFLMEVASGDNSQITLLRSKKASLWVDMKNQIIKWTKYYKNVGFKS